MKKMTVLAVMLFCGYLLATAVPKQMDAKPELVYQTLNAGDMIFQYAVDGKNLKVKLFAPTTGWIAAGFDPGFAMKKANFIIGFAEGDKVVIEDHFGSGLFSHKTDVELGGKDDILEKSAAIRADGTELSFTIPLDSGDAYDKKMEIGNKYKVLLAYGASSDLTKKHKKKSSVKMQL
jgi:hypothetical protein